MILTTKRCIHCNTPYTFQASGGGAGEFNHEKYCPSCQEVIV